MKILLILLMLYPTISFGKTYKSDGSIISNSGEIIKESRSVRYQKAQKAFQNGEEITDWPTVKANKNGKSYGQKNYFGHEILEVGAPLLSLEQLRIKDGNIMEAVAKNHGFENRDLVEHKGPERAAKDMVNLIKKAAIDKRNKMRKNTKEVYITVATVGDSRTGKSEMAEKMEGVLNMSLI